MLPVSVLFISCDLSERTELDDLRRALKPACASYNVGIRDACSLSAGADIEQEVQRHIQEALIIVLVLTQSYLASDSCKRQWQAALCRRQHGAVVIPIRWGAYPEASLPAELAGLQPLPRSVAFVRDANSREQILTEIVSEIVRHLGAARRVEEHTTWPPADMPNLSAAQYVSLHNRALSAVAQLEKLGEQLKLESAKARAGSLQQALLRHLYSVVVTGRSRAGKSTLLNALLGRTICPSKRRRTTAVPTIIGPGAKEAAVITLHDGTQIPLQAPLTAELLKPYADQDQNPVNSRKVKDIKVTLADRVLAMGVTYTDIPGFDDPTETISSAAWETIKSAHALVLVIDISPHAHGGFAIDRQTIDFLRQAKEQGCKVLLVGNKADVLTPEQQAEIKDEVRSDLRRAGIEAPALFVLSSTMAYENRVEKGAFPEPFAHFFDSLWRSLWRTEGIGLRRLYQVFGQLQAGSEEVMALFAIRDKKEDERERLRAALAGCRDDCALLQARCHADFQADRADVANLVAAVQTQLQRQIDVYVAALPQEGPIPRVSKLLEHLEPAVRKAGEALIGNIVRRMGHRVDSLSREMEARLTQLRDEAGLPGELRQIKVSLLSLPGWQNELQHPALLDERGEVITLVAGAISLGMGALGWTILGPVGGFFAFGMAGAITSWVGDRFIARPTSREELVKRCHNLTAERLMKMKEDLERKHDDMATLLASQIHAGMSPFMTDMGHRLEEIRAPTEDERRLHSDFAILSQEALHLLATTLKEKPLTARPQ